MGIVLSSTHPPGPFRWRLFLLVMLIMASITAAAIILTLKANPRRDSLRAPPTQPVSHLILPARPPKSC